MAIDRKLLDLSEKAILYRLGGIEYFNLSSELANTIANIYYRFFSVFSSKHNIDDIPALFEELDIQVDIVEIERDPAQVLMSTIDEFEDIKESLFPFQKLRDSKKSDYFIKNMSGGYVQRARALIEFRFINAIIGYLRILQSQQEQWKYGVMMVEIIIDVFKYQIKRSPDKTPIRRNIERKFKKKKVDEIPNLIDLLDVMNQVNAEFHVTKKELDDKDEEDISMKYLHPVTF